MPGFDTQQGCTENGAEHPAAISSRCQVCPTRSSFAVPTLQVERDGPAKVRRHSMYHVNGLLHCVIQQGSIELLWTKSKATAELRSRLNHGFSHQNPAASILIPYFSDLDVFIKLRRAIRPKSAPRAVCGSHRGSDRCDHCTRRLPMSSPVATVLINVAAECASVV